MLFSLTSVHFVSLCSTLVIAIPAELEHRQARCSGDNCYNFFKSTDTVGVSPYCLSYLSTTLSTIVSTASASTIIVPPTQTATQISSVITTTTPGVMCTSTVTASPSIVNKRGILDDLPLPFPNPLTPVLFNLRAQLACPPANRLDQKARISSACSCILTPATRTVTNIVTNTAQAETVTVTSTSITATATASATCSAYVTATATPSCQNAATQLTPCDPSLGCYRNDYPPDSTSNNGGCIGCLRRGEDPTFDSVKERPLPPDEFTDFLNRSGPFEPDRSEGAELKGGVRFILQPNARDPQTFAPDVLSLEVKDYENMVHALRLPMKAVESSSCVGPFFWAGMSLDKGDRCFQVVQRKSDVRKKGCTTGWELMLSYDLRSNVTSAFCKGTLSSDIGGAIATFMQCSHDVLHPLLLPMILLTHVTSVKTDMTQRDARDWLRRLEHAVSMRAEIIAKTGYLSAGFVDLDAVNRDLIECRSQALWKPSVNYLRLIDLFHKALDLFGHNLASDKITPEIQRMQDEMRCRLNFNKSRWEGRDAYATVTLSRIDTQINSSPCSKGKQVELPDSD
ncbi:hypothetical protein VTL71DRAFT_4340 [Oculimacula yallundae]|uniref:Uncharacterized protein n=1 Tax=Oculimacula yallundae TaxID=86028 RepID=A0ABR4C2W7_9HELO